MPSASSTPPTATLQRPPTADVVDEADDDALSAQLLVVRVGSARYGIPVAQVREVFRVERVTRVPGAAACVRGIVNLRGAVVTVLELAVLLGAPRAVASSSVVLIEHGSRLVGLAVDAVRDVRSPEADPAGDAAAEQDAPLMALDAVALCAPHLLSSEEMER